MKTLNIKNSLLTWRGKFNFLLIGLSLAFLVSCNNDETTPDFTAEEVEDANLDAIEDSYFDDGDDLVTEAFTATDAELSGGRIQSDERLLCAELTRTGSKAEGSLRVNFGSGCKDPRGNVRMGSIVVVHKGSWNEAGSQWTITFEEYSINGIKIEGTRKVTVVSVTELLTTYEVVLTGGKVTWPDGRIATREVNRRREHERNENNILDRLIIYGTAQGTFRNGRGYSIEILERLIYRRACASEGVIIPVSGVKLIKHGDRELTVDYGDGTCDNFVTLTNKNGRTVRYEVKQ
jgi:hypothetical protein